VVRKEDSNPHGLATASLSSWSKTRADAIRLASFKRTISGNLLKQNPCDDFIRTDSHMTQTRRRAPTIAASNLNVP
jgi:hypothetical protein